jgi:hypothetical protein
MKRASLTEKHLRKIIKEEMEASGPGGGSVKKVISDLVGLVTSKLKMQYPPEAVQKEGEELAKQIEALIRSSVAKLKSSKPAAPQAGAAAKPS